MNEGNEQVFRGVAASPGMAHGPAFVFFQRDLEVPTYRVGKKEVASEKSRFEDALAKTREQIGKLRVTVSENLGEKEARIFDAHLLVLEDQALIGETLKEQQDSLYNIEHCFENVSRRYLEAFAQMEDAYMRERAVDIRDVAKRVMHNLVGENAVSVMRFNEPRIIVSEDFTPSDAAEVRKDIVLGIVTNAGSRTSHSVIMARSMQVPAVVGLHDITEHLKNDDYVIVDGYEGIVVVNPTEATLSRYGQVRRERQTIQKVFESVNPLPAKTRDGHRLKLMVNIEGAEDMRKSHTIGSDGIGLFRTEALFLRSDHVPSEEEQVEVYRNVVEGISPLPVTIRTLDLGGDKRRAGHFLSMSEENPFMGCRAIRLCLENRGLFKTQLRAILRASAFGSVRMMYPMVSSIDELQRANALLEEAKDELREEAITFDEKMEVGSMIETPAAALTMDALSKYCSFFSIGTNDLIQYILAVDRVNDRVAHLYQPNHPAVLRLLKMIVEGGQHSNVEVSVCGEMASDPLYASLLLGMGVKALSVTPSSLPEVKYLMRSMELAKAQEMAEQVMRMEDPRDIVHTLRDYYADVVGDLYRG